ncbi:uncharacterized protein [Palaemon carinicauda]|uniref:uncharacterized protein n=1 Tax=Palaemon carinicauda TaxID=392227 RepID=UPI0035B5B973
MHGCGLAKETTLALGLVNLEPANDQFPVPGMLSGEDTLRVDSHYRSGHALVSVRFRYWGVRTFGSLSVRSRYWGVHTFGSLSDLAGVESSPKTRPKSRTIRFNSNSVATTPSNPFLSVSSSGRLGDRSDEVLSTKDTIKIMAGILPALTKALIDSKSTGAEKMRDITLAFLPLARDVVESRGNDFGRSVNNDEVTAVEYAEQAVPPFMDFIVDYVDEVATEVPFQFDADEVLDNIPEIKLPKFDGPFIPDVEIPDIVIPDFNARG